MKKAINNKEVMRKVAWVNNATLPNETTNRKILAAVHQRGQWLEGTDGLVLLMAKVDFLPDGETAVLDGVTLNGNEVSISPVEEYYPETRYVIPNHETQPELHTLTADQLKKIVYGLSDGAFVTMRLPVNKNNPIEFFITDPRDINHGRYAVAMPRLGTQYDLERPTPKGKQHE